MPKLPLPCFLVAYCYLSLIAMAADVNVTLDDTHASISYHPLRSWAARIAHYRTRVTAYNRTWHEPAYAHPCSETAESSEPISMSVNFIGTALYLYSPPGCSTPPGLTYNLDGRTISSMSAHSADSPIFAYWNLSNTPHNLIVEVDPASTFSFDYLIYTTATEPIPSMLVQARQAASDNSTTSSDPSSTSPPPPPNDTKTQIGAIAYAVAASVGITSLFSIGLAISIIKIRRQRHRVRRETRREHDRNRSRGLAIHLPPASVSASTPQRPTRHSADTSASVEPPSYDTAMRPTGRNSITPGQSPYVMHSHLATISEVATVLSMSQPSISSHRDPSTIREDSLEGMPPSPPGLGDQQPPPAIENLVEPQNQSSTSQQPGVRSDHDA